MMGAESVLSKTAVVADIAVIVIADLLPLWSECKMVKPVCLNSVAIS